MRKASVSAQIAFMQRFRETIRMPCEQREDQEEHTGAVAQASADLKARVEADESALKAYANAADGTELTCPSIFSFMTLIPEEYSTADFVGYWG
jgi:hypothetical protein